MVESWFVITPRQINLSGLRDFQGSPLRSADAARNRVYAVGGFNGLSNSIAATFEAFTACVADPMRRPHERERRHTGKKPWQAAMTRETQSWLCLARKGSRFARLACSADPSGREIRRESGAVSVE